MKIETQCLHEGYTPANGEPLTLPIYQSTTYKYESTAQVAKLFDLAVDGHMYSRISNPTVAAVEEKIAALEGGVGALCTTSGQAATLICILNILRAGDHILCASTIYGGTINLFAVTLKRFGIEVSFVDADADEQTLCSQLQPNTKAVFAETIANPAIAVLDIEKMARVAHSRGIPLIIDRGVLLEEESLKELEEKNAKYIHFITSNAKKAAQVIESLFQTKNVKITDEYNLYLYDTVLPVAKINRTLIESGIDIKELHLCEETLEDYFKKITGGEGIA